MALSADLLVNIVNDVGTALISVVTAVVISYGLTRSIKRTELRVGFSERWLSIMDRIHDINRAEVEHQAGRTALEAELAQMDVNECFRWLFTLMFDEFVSYQDGYLERGIFTQWMTFNMDLAGQDDVEGSYRIGRTTYMQGWERYKKAYPFVDPTFVAFMDRVHAARQARDRNTALKAAMVAYGRGFLGLLGPNLGKPS